MKYVVTGGAGSLGQAVNRQLLDAGHEVVAIDTKWPHQKIESDQLRTIVADLTDEKLLYAHLDGVDGLCHAGAIPHSTTVLDGRVYHNNILSTYNVFQAACDVGVRRVVNVSSVQACGLFGRTQEVKEPAFLPIDESVEVINRNCYGLAKRHGERLADLCVERYGDTLSVVSLRFPLILRHIEHWIKRLPEWVQNKNHGRNDYWTLVTIDEAAETCVRSLQAELQGHRVCFAHSTRPMDARSWKEIRQEHFPQVEWRGETEDEPLVSLQTLRETLGWTPTRGYDDFFDPEKSERLKPF